MANETLRAAAPPTALARPAAPRARRRYPTLRRLLRHKLFLTGSTLVLIVSLAALLADLITVADPLKLSIRDRFEPPSLEFPFGTDNFGRSQWSRAIYGARLSLLDRPRRGPAQCDLRHAARRAAPASFRHLDNSPDANCGRLHGLSGDPALHRHHRGARPPASSTR